MPLKASVPHSQDEHELLSPHSPATNTLYLDTFFFIAPSLLLSSLTTHTIKSLSRLPLPPPRFWSRSFPAMKATGISGWTSQLLSHSSDSYLAMPSATFLYLKTHPITLLLYSLYDFSPTVTTWTYKTHSVVRDPPWSVLPSLRGLLSPAGLLRMSCSLAKRPLLRS